MDMAAELEKLAALRDNGTLTEEEFQKAKTALLETPPPPPLPPPVAVVTVNANPFDEKTWAMLLHLSQLVFGLIGPAVLWAIKKEESAYVDENGRNALNWQLTMLIVSMVILVLGFPTCGVAWLLFFPLMIPLILFPILAGIKASKGETWKYPCAIEFIK
jgi:uncharacterized Tic20 family protein